MNRRTRCKRNQKGGGLGGIVAFSPADAQRIQNPLAWKAESSCLAATRTGTLTGVEGGGLPGMSKGLIGGGRRRRGGKKGKRSSKSSRRTFKQRGGRYGFEFADLRTVSGSPGNASYPSIGAIPCESSRQAVPDSGAIGGLNTRSSYLWQGHGGALPLSGAPINDAPLTNTPLSSPPITWPNHGAASGSPSEMVPTARYSVNSEPGIVTAAGGRLAINTPFNYNQINPACKQTGGGRKSRKNRKASRKNRKGSRRH